MKFENENAKREFIGLLAKRCAEAFIASRYPNQAFNFPFPGISKELAYPIIELHIRIPAAGCLPGSLKPPIGHMLSAEERSTVFRSCPAIESIRLRSEFQRCGFLNALMRELSRAGIPYVNLSNIANSELALHYLNLSRIPGTGVELTSATNTVSPTTLCPTFSVNLRERYKVREI